MRPPAKPKDEGIFSPDSRHQFPVSFTGDAINQLTAFGPALFDIREWIWHVEVINGVQYCVVTDRLPHPEMTASVPVPGAADHTEDTWGV